MVKDDVAEDEAKIRSVRTLSDIRLFMTSINPFHVKSVVTP